MVSLVSRETATVPSRWEPTQLASRIRELHPGAFAFVMATGILSSAELLLGADWLSTAFLVAASAGYAVLCILFFIRILRFTSEAWADTARPDRAFAFFTFVAGSNVVAVRLASTALIGLAEALSVIAAVAWLVLAYGILARVVLADRKPEPAAAVNGTWLIWVVGTQSVSIAASVLGAGLGISSDLAALVAVSLWALGALLYVILMAIILARLVLVRLEPVQASPPYWISMGATAITVLAGAELLMLPQNLPSLVAARSTIEGMTLVLWAFGTWWFPFLILLTIWRYLRLKHPMYEQTLWSMVFPLGMYAVATDVYGRAAGLSQLPGIAGGELWLALAGWVVVAAWMVVSWFAPGWPGGSMHPQRPENVG